MNDLLNAKDGLIEQICQEMTPEKTEPPASLPGQTLVSETQRPASSSATWCLQFNHTDPSKLTLTMTAPAHAPLPVTLKFSSTMDKNQALQLIKWLSGILVSMDELV